MTPSLHFHAYVGVQHCYHFDYNTPWVKMNPSAKFYPVGPAVYPPMRNIVVVFIDRNATRAQLLPSMADRLCLHRRCVEYLATGNFYLLA